MGREHLSKASPHSILVRPAVRSDALALLHIYAPYVTETAITFEYEVPSEEEFQKRIETTLTRYPYLVAEADGQIAGYCYASAFHARAAYGWCAEVSIYVDNTMHGRGVGHMLYEKLEELLMEQHILNLYACIAYPNPKSIQFHSSFGYKTIGHFHHCGFKLGKWWDMIWMEKMLGEHEASPKPVLLPQKP